VINNRPWIDHYDEGVPSKLDYPAITIPDILSKSAFEYPENIALVQGEKSITYSALYSESELLAHRLKGWGLQKGDRVAICIPNQIEFVISFYAILMAGGVVAALNPSYPVRELEFQVGIAKSKYIIATERYFEKLIAIKSQIRFDILVILKNDKEFAEVSFGINRSGEKSESLNKTISLHEINPDDPAILQFSGGTTGLPKAAVGLHRNVTANVLQFSKWLTGLRLGQEVFLTAIPLFHVYGMVIGLNVAIAIASKIVLVDNPGEIDALIETIKEQKASVFPGVPSLFAAINQFLAKGISTPDLTSLKICISGSAPLPHKTKEAFENFTGAKLVEGYGLSEAPTATHCNPIIGENRDGSIGLPLPDVECKIVSLEDGSNSVATHQIGELLIKGPQIMQEYFENKLETVNALISGWLHTGDIAQMDADGYFFIVGRKKELIKVGGLQVWPNEVEEVLRAIPGVKECAITGISDEYYGEVVKAWVVVEAGISITLDSIKEFCEDKLVNYKIPKVLKLIDELPKSTIGKLLRYKLK
jgi:long-chain acyl-CoA synthetase